MISKKKTGYLSKITPMRKLKGKEILVETNESPMKKRKINLAIADSPSSKSCLCRICKDRKSTSRMLKETQCNHYFCFDCIRRFIATKLKDEDVIMVQCPEANCKGLIMPDQCKSIIPEEVIYRWKNALLDSMISPVVVYECPFEECKEKLVDDGEVEFECPKCCTRICGECKNFEHGDIDCEEFCFIEEDRRI